MLALDAALIAVAWQSALAGPGAVSALERAALFFATWTVYLADRLGDIGGHRELSDIDLPLRHRMFRARSRAYVGALILVGGTGAILATQLPAEVLMAGGALALVTAGYLVAVQRIRTVRERPAVRLALVAGIFAAGCGIPGILRADVESLAAPLAVLAIFCWVNCAQIERIESRRAVDIPWVAAWLLGMAAAIWGMIFLGNLSVFAALCGSGLMLVATGWITRRSEPEAGGTWADAALFLPPALALLG